VQVKKQKYMEAIIAFIDDYRDETGLSPSMTEIAEGVGLTQGTISKYVAYMKEQGMLNYDGRVRGIRTKKASAFAGAYTAVPVVGRIACGAPILAVESIDGYIQLPKSLVGPGEYYLLKTVGNSMIGAGIEEDDLVLVRSQDTAEKNEIVVALIEDEATLKRFLPQEDGTVILHPENPDLEDIVVDAAETEYLRIQGVVKKVIKDVG
jgi:repressor LexA